HNAETQSLYKLSLSVGAAFYDHENSCSIEDLIRRADKLMYEQKRSRKKE
ncbi:diguanylate cyclase domain-containing protein, partial [Fibrobacterota bacterium]